MAITEKAKSIQRQKRNQKMKDAGGAMSAGVALSIVITQSLSAAGVSLGQDIVGPLGVVLSSIIHEAKNYFSGTS